VLANSTHVSIVDDRGMLSIVQSTKRKS